MTDKQRYQVGIVGARGHVGAELLRLLLVHPRVSLAFVGSRALAGTRVSEVVKGADASLFFEHLEPEQLTDRKVDLVFLALPNGLSDPFVQTLRQREDTCHIIDLSADHRFDEQWAYGLPERGRQQLHAAPAIANPGCYATAAQLALAPLCDQLAAPPHVFGVSGYSGAGTTPSPRNDPEQLRDNLMPYRLVGHIHEREISHHLKHPVCFMPHVAAFFRGITLTIAFDLSNPTSATELLSNYRAYYANEPLIRIIDDIPCVRDAADQHHVTIGGFHTDGTRGVLVATIDNLLKGAATQAVQNLNLALGIAEFTGLPQQP